MLEDLNKPGRKVCVANTHLFWHPKGTVVLIMSSRFLSVHLPLHTHVCMYVCMNACMCLYLCVYVDR